MDNGESFSQHGILWRVSRGPRLRRVHQICTTMNPVLHRSVTRAQQPLSTCSTIVYHFFCISSIASLSREVHLRPCSWVYTDSQGRESTEADSIQTATRKRFPIEKKTEREALDTIRGGRTNDCTRNRGSRRYRQYAVVAAWVRVMKHIPQDVS